MKKKISALEFKKLLNRVYLGGTIEECVLNVDSDGVGCIQAVDMTNSLFLRCEKELAINVKDSLGLGNLKLLCGYLETCGEEEISISVNRNRMVLIRRGHGRLSYLLSESNVIPTNVEEADAVKKLLKGIDLRVTVSEGFRDDLLMYLNLTGLGAVRFSVNQESDKILAMGGTDSDHKFRLLVSKIEGESKEFEFEVNARILAAILSVLEFEEKPTFGFGDNQPLIITNGENSLWALVPAEEEGR